MERACRWACPPWCMTFDFSHVLPWAWQEVKGETGSVNEADYLCSNLLKVAGTSSGCGECVAPPIQLMRLAVAWAALYSGLVECVNLWVLCAICKIGYKLPVASRRLAWNRFP